MRVACRAEQASSATSHSRKEPFVRTACFSVKTRECVNACLRQALSLVRSLQVKGVRARKGKRLG